MSLSIVTNEDNMEMMARLPDQSIGLAIIDPPYGNSIMSKNKRQSHKTTDSTYRNKSTPQAAYYSELFRVSRRQIIWGAQYQVEHLRPGGSMIVWDKKADPDLHNMSACDVAWYSRPSKIRKFNGAWCGAVKCEPGPTIHIHQKPVSLYRWLLKHYAEPGDIILDTHMGSQSSRIAAHDLGYDYYGCELDAGYFQAGCDRFERHIQQLTIFSTTL